MKLTQAQYEQIDAAGAYAKNKPQSVAVSRGGRNTQIHMVAASDRIAVAFQLSGGQCHDTPQGRLFRRIKGFRRVCTGYEKLDIMYLAFLNLVLIYDELKL